MGLKELDDSNLVLGLGFSSSSSEEQHMLNPKVMTEKISNFEPSLTLCLSGDHHNPLYRQDSTGASSFSNVSVKREREMEVEVELAYRSVGAIISDHEDDHIVDTNGCRKKLRLTKAQSELLEESFKHHSTLNPKQKQDLARDLKLRPRQVEVWFQNRRARTKLKQTEVECELLKKWCETLRDENKRLHKEVQDLKALQIAPPHHYSMQLPAATLTMCPSCEQLITENTAKSKPQYYLYNRCTNPSTAC